MTRIVERLCRLLETGIGLALALMVILVFSNVVLRYAFNSGIAISEELARWLFVWITFLGAAAAIQRRSHMGTDLLVRLLPRRLRCVCLGLGQLLMLYVCWLLLDGSWQQIQINLTTRSAVMEVSVAWFYAAGAVFAVLGGAMVLLQFARLVTGQATPDELGFAAARPGETRAEEVRS